MITKRRLLFLSGILIVLNAAVFGLPFVYESSLNIGLGLFVIVIAFLLGRTKPVVHRNHRKRERSSDIYAENLPDVAEHVSGVHDDHGELLAQNYENNRSSVNADNLGDDR